MQTTEYQLTDIEQDIRPEDFPESSFWHKFVRVHGAQALIDLVNKAGGARLYILNHDRATKGARLRDRIEKFHVEQTVLMP